MNGLNLHPKVIFATLGAGIGEIATLAVDAAIKQCGGSSALEHAVAQAVLPVLGAAILGYLKSSGSWTPAPPAK